MENRLKAESLSRKIWPRKLLRLVPLRHSRQAVQSAARQGHFFGCYLGASSPLPVRLQVEEQQSCSEQRQVLQYDSYVRFLTIHMSLVTTSGRPSAVY